MARLSKFSKPTYINMPLCQHVLLRHYGHMYMRDVTDIMRTIIAQYAKADPTFKADEFQQYVTEQHIPELIENGAERELIEELERQIKGYLGGNYDKTLSPVTAWETQTGQKTTKKKKRKR